jgi:SAM-dependent methyltransferase
VRRFDLLGAMWNEATFRRIHALGIGDGWRCREAGAGGDSVPRWLSRRVGSTGYVLASDIDTSVLDDTADRRYEVKRHDLTIDPPPAGDFDLAHARLVLEHLADPVAVLATLVAALRPGGWLLVESFDPKLQPLACPDEVGPREALANKVRLAFWEYYGRTHHVSLGRTLPRLLRQAGLADVVGEARFPLGGPASQLMQRVLLGAEKHSIVADGAVTAKEFDQHLADLGSAELDIAVFLTVSAWGRKPLRDGGEAP